MCGIADIIYKQQGSVGDALLKMLGGCQHRGPDSTGLAMYGQQAGEQLVLRLFLDADLSHQPNVWPNRLDRVQHVLDEHGFEKSAVWHEGAFARLAGMFAGDIQRLSYAVEEVVGVEIFSAGYYIEVIKDEGPAADIEQRFDCRSFTGTHGIGHVRLSGFS